MNVYKGKAYAKINLTLEITGVENNYHLLDSLVASIELCDEVKLTKRADDYSTITMQGMGSESIPSDTNNALKAALAFSKKCKCNGVDIEIKKNIPLGGGLGGSSTDASAVLVGMSKLYGIEDTSVIEEIADSLGSDTKYLLTGGYKRMQGRGDLLGETDIQKELHILLLCPESSVSAGACYKKYDELPQTLQWRESATDGCIKALLEGNIHEAGRYVRNDLYIPALHLNDDVLIAQKEMEALQPVATCMTGSGSCVFGIFESAKDCQRAKKNYQGKFRVIATRTRTV